MIPAGTLRGDRIAQALVALAGGLATASWVGLAAAQLGYFSFGIVVVPAIVVTWCVWPRRQGGGWDGAPTAILLFGALLWFFGRGYDAIIGGSDATVYMSVSAHVAQTGELAFDDPILRWLPQLTERFLFPSFGVPPDDVFESKSEDGLVYWPETSLVYGAYPQITSVWLAIGRTVAGLDGALWMPGLTAALALTCLFVLLRRWAGGMLAAGSVVWLATQLPQLFSARIPMGEVLGQCGVFAGLLAVDLWQHDRRRSLALVAGVLLGVAGLARPEMFVFLTVAVLGCLGMGAGRRVIPWLGLLPWLAAVVHQGWLILVVVPSPYPHAFRIQGLQALEAMYAHRWLFGGILGAALVAVRLWGRGGWWPGLWRALLVLVAPAFVAVWFGLPPSPYARRTIGWIASYSSWAPVGGAIIGWWLLFRGSRERPIARLALLLSTIALVCFAWDLRITTGPVWGGRRLLLAALPLVGVATTAAVAGLAQWWRPLGPLVFAGLLATNVRGATPLLGPHFYDGASEGIARIAEQLPPDAITLIHHGFRWSLIDIPLALEHGRAIGMMRRYDPRLLAQALTNSEQHPVYFIQPDSRFLQAPNVPGLVFEDIAFVDFVVQRPFTYAPKRPGVFMVTGVPARIYRVRRESRGR